MVRSIEEQVERYYQNLLSEHGVRIFYKTDFMSVPIERALQEAPSKGGGSGGNKPDIRCFIRHGGYDVPVMIEVKGMQGKLAKFNKDGFIANENAKGDPAWNIINGFAVNGAIHYAKAILEFAGDDYDSCLAIGINGYDDAGQRVYETQIWYVSSDNLGQPKRLSNDDVSVLWNKRELDELIDNCVLTDAERANMEKALEDRMDANLRDLNQYMHNGFGEKDKRGRSGLNLSVSARVPLVCGMIMAGLGVESEGVPPLKVEDLRGIKASMGKVDGAVLLEHVDMFLRAKNLPDVKRKMVVDILRPTFQNSALNVKGEDSETKVKRLYREVLSDIVPYVDTRKAGYLDFTGKLFNVLTEWVDIPDGGANDVVLTPRYVTDMMARICDVRRNDYVWDYALGTAGFLVSSMRLMLADADNIDDVDVREQVKLDIRASHLIGVEKRDDIYMLAVLNMVLMGDGSANIICDNSLDWDGCYQHGEHAGEQFPATVFLLNPPYSAAGKGMVFAERAMSRMGVGGRAAVLIQENAGSGNGHPYTEKILEHNTLKAVIHMADIFKGKAGVQTAVYVFDCGVPHDERKEVVFIDMSEDGYTRQNRKKASSATNLRDTDHARERYAEVVDIVLGRKKATDFYKDGEHVFRDCIGLTGDDWTVNQHRKFDTTPTEGDFKKVVAEYLSWKVGAILKGEMTLEEATAHV